MCGLIGWLGKEHDSPAARAKQYVVEQFEDQQGRGTRGFGVVRIDDRGYVHVLRATEPVKMMIDLYNSETKHLFLHHRSPTSSANTLDQTHPLEVDHDELKFRWLIMHNGTISNDDTLKTKHEKLGYVYLTEYKEKYVNYTASKFNDSESLAIELARFLEGKQGVIEAKGGFAFMAISMTKDTRVHKVYIGQNGYGGINLADYGYGFAFASEERAGEAVSKDTAVVFSSKWKGTALTGFDQEKETITLKYPAAEPVKSPYSDEYKDHGTYGSTMGFGKHRKDHTGGGLMGYKKDKDGVWVKEKSDKEPGDVRFASYGHIVEFVSKGKLGQVFKTDADHVALTEFKLADFNKLIIEGKPELAEDFYNKYIGNLYEWFDMGDVLEGSLEPMDLRIPEAPTTADIIKASHEVAGNRMKEIASGYLPLFKLCSYCECIIALAYQFQIELPGRIDNANPDKPLSEEFKEIDELWPGDKDEDKIPPELRTTPQTEIVRQKFLGKDDERTSSINLLAPGKPAEPPKEDRRGDMDTDAGAMLSALSESASEMLPEDLYREAENVGDTIRSAAELAIIEQLAMVEKIAIEDGSPIRIPFQFNQIKNELEKTERRFSTLAHVVKATKDKEEADSGGWDHNGVPRDYLSG